MLEFSVSVLWRLRTLDILTLDSRTPDLCNLEPLILDTFTLNSEAFFVDLLTFTEALFNEKFYSDAAHILSLTDDVKSIFRSSHQRCSIKEGVLKNFAKFARKLLCQSLFFNKVSDLRPFNNTFFTEHLWATASLYLKDHAGAALLFSILTH